MKVAAMQTKSPHQEGGQCFTRKTLFFDATAQAAVLVTNQDGRRSSAAMPFPEAHAALDWCLANRCAFVMTPGPDPKAN
jgi:hypothetical protein